MTLNPFVLLNRHSEVIRFDSEYDVPESVHRLGATVQRRFQSTIGRSLHGIVTERRVVVGRLEDNKRNSLAPFFVGSFKTLDGKTVLEGTFGLRPSVRAFGLFWIWYSVPIGIIMCLAFVAVKSVPEALTCGLAAIIFPLFLAGLLNLGNWQAKDHQQYITKRIREILTPSQNWDEPDSGSGLNRI